MPTPKERKPKVPVIRVTKDYGLFAFTDENRVISTAHVNKVGREVDRKNLSQDSPIKVKPLDNKYADEEHPNGKYIIVEGQHTYLALVDRREWIFYQITETFDIEDISHFNSVRKNWSFDDYLSSYCKKGLNAYKVYAGFKKRSGWAHSNLILMLMGNNSGALQAFKDGKFKIRMDISEANMLVEMVNDFGSYLDFYKTRAFIKACTVMFRAHGYNHKKMLGKMDYLSTRILKSVYWDDYLKQLEQIYNYKAQGRTVRFY